MPMHYLLSGGINTLCGILFDILKVHLYFLQRSDAAISKVFWGDNDGGV